MTAQAVMMRHPGAFLTTDAMLTGGDALLGRAAPERANAGRGGAQHRAAATARGRAASEDDGAPHTF
jgi:hypothetical protein